MQYERKCTLNCRRDKRWRLLPQ